jgi:hypothetical protein
MGGNGLMSLDLFQYDKMVESAMRTVVRDALAKAATDGLPGQHHFYISFRTGFPGVHLSDALRARFPEDMTIVLQHQYWGLTVQPASFEVTLSFSGVQERLVIPFAAITGFVDPSVKFGLQFKPDPDAAETPGVRPASAPKPAAATQQKPPPAAPAHPPHEGPGEVVALDAFRKK